MIELNDPGRNKFNKNRKNQKCITNDESIADDCPDLLTPDYF